MQYDAADQSCTQSQHSEIARMLFLFMVLSSVKRTELLRCVTFTFSPVTNDGDRGQVIPASDNGIVRSRGNSGLASGESFILLTLLE